MQAVHHKTLSCSVIAKGRKYSGDKFKRLSDAINAAGEKGAQLKLKIKAMHDNDVSDMPWGCPQFCVAAVSGKLLPYNIIAF